MPAAAIRHRQLLNDLLRTWLHLLIRSAGTEPLTSDQLDQQVRQGTQAVFALQIGSQLLSFVVLAILLRWVGPQEFGILGMVMPVVLLANMFVLASFKVVIVQQQHLSRAQLSTLFWINVGAAAVAAAVVAAAGPLLATLYGAPAVALVCVALSGSLVVGACGSQHLALLERKLKMRQVSIARVTSLAVAGVAAIVVALLGGGVWALVVQQYVDLLVLAAIVWYLEPFRPGLPQTGTGLRKSLRFGGYYSLSGLMFFFALQADKVLLAWMLGSTAPGQAALGMYTQSFSIMMRPVYAVTNPLTSIMLPALSRARGNLETYGELVARFFRMAATVHLPCGLGLLVVAHDVIAVIGGPDWEPAGSILAAFAPVIVVQGVTMIVGSVMASAGRSDRLFFGSVIVTVLLLQGYACGSWLGRLYGDQLLGPPLGCALAYTLVWTVVITIPYLLFCFATVGVRPALSVFTSPLRASLIMAIVVYLARQLLLVTAIPVFIRLVILVGVGIGVYAALGRRDLKWLWNQLVPAAA